MKIQRAEPDALYLHVPFCASICAYCDFCHQIYREDVAEKWLQALQKEMQAKKINLSLDTVYIGGGTPTCLNENQLERLLSLLDPYVSHVSEYTVEINPETLTQKKTEILRKHGINRVSIGFQSSDPGLLKLMGRHHDLDMIAHCMQECRGAGMDNISLDLMYSLPGQTMEMLQQSVEDALSLDPSHLSLYSLTIEPNSVFGRKGYRHLDEDTEADMYEWIEGRLEKAGYHQYEISNFAKDGKQSRHNKKYWLYEDFYGISCGASGKEGNRRYDNTRSLKKYLEDPLLHEDILLSEKDMMFESVMMGLRLKDGFPPDHFEKAFGKTFMQVYNTKAEALIRKGLLEVNEKTIRATEEGYEILNSVLVDLMDD